MENNERLVTGIYGDVDICTNEEAKRLKELKKIESNMFSKYTMNVSKNFIAWW